MSGAAEPGKLAGVVRDFLDGLPPPLAEAVRAAAVPHAFDVQVLAAMLDLEPAQAERACGALRDMPFVQAMGDSRYALHEMVRDFLLDALWRERREDYRAWSRRAAQYFERDDQDASRLEAAYHWLVADPDRGADLVRIWGWQWHNAFHYERGEALVQLGLEHDKAGRLSGRARGWVYFRKGQAELRYSQNREAFASLETALEEGRGDQHLQSSCIKSLGDVHLQVAEYGAARERYEEALTMYQSFFPPDHPDVNSVREKLEELRRR